MLKEKRKKKDNKQTQKEGAEGQRERDSFCKHLN